MLSANPTLALRPYKVKRKRNIKKPPAKGNQVAFTTIKQLSSQFPVINFAR